jgi:hypothetical protein
MVLDKDVCITVFSPSISGVPNQIVILSNGSIEVSRGSVSIAIQKGFAFETNKTRFYPDLVRTVLEDNGSTLILNTEIKDRIYLQALKDFKVSFAWIHYMIAKLRRR